MSESSAASPLIYIIIAILTAIGGYFTRIFQKYEDRRDDVHLKILPALYHHIHYYIESSNIYIERKNFEDFKSTIEHIVSNLTDKISSGQIIFTKINSFLLQELYWKLQKMKIIMDDISKLVDDSEKKQRKEQFVDAFTRGNKDYSRWLTVDPRQMLEDARTIEAEVDRQIKRYTSYSFILVILIIAAAVIAGLANYLPVVLEPSNDKFNNQSQVSPLNQTAMDRKEQVKPKVMENNPVS